jgi:hypothetical protein
MLLITIKIRTNLFQMYLDPAPYSHNGENLKSNVS